jgi:beta-glucosidase
LHRLLAIMGLSTSFGRSRLIVSLFAAAALISTSSCLPGVREASHTPLVHSRSIQANETVLPYQNASLCIDDRVEDLLSRMTVEEKAGQLFHTQLQQGPNGTLDLGNATTFRNSTENMVGEKFMTHFNLVGEVKDVGVVAGWYNLVQELALSTRLGIPITLSSDPRHSFTVSPLHPINRRRTPLTAIDRTTSAPASPPTNSLNGQRVSVWQL